MSAYIDMAAINSGLKELITDQYVQTLVYTNNPLWALLKKDEAADFGGKYKPVPIITNTAQGASGTFANAQGNQIAAEIEAFQLTVKNYYQIVTIDRKTLLSARTNKMAFVQATDTKFNGGMRRVVNGLASQMFRSGTGTIGRVSTTVAISGGVITLQNPADAVQFERNMVLQAASSDGGTPRAALGYVIATNKTASPPTITVSATGIGGTAGTPSGWTTSDYLLVQGDSNTLVSGLQAWLPASAPTSGDNFYGVDRSIDPTRLAGIRLDVSGFPIEEGLIDLAMLVGREGGTSTHFFGNYGIYGALDKALGSKVQYVDLEGPAKIGFRGIRVNGPQGEIKVMMDRNTPQYAGFMLQMDTWQLDSILQAPHVFTYGADNSEMLRVYNADAGEMRIGSYCNLEGNAPGWNAVGTFGV